MQQDDGKEIDSSEAILKKRAALTAKKEPIPWVAEEKRPLAATRKKLPMSAKRDELLKVYTWRDDEYRNPRIVFLCRQGAIFCSMAIESILL